MFPIAFLVELAIALDRSYLCRAGATIFFKRAVSQKVQSTNSFRARYEILIT